MRRPGKGCNHLAWQLGHLITSEAGLLEGIAPGKGVSLPDGFAEAHSKEACENDDPSAFRRKDEYLQWYDKAREATLAALDGLSESDLDQPAPEHLRAFAPTVGDVFALIASHPLMHAGQFVIIRRELDKPILM
jgi:hypothetical protein